jgi:hypothetical protein
MGTERHLWVVLALTACVACGDEEPAAPTFADVQDEALRGCAFSTCHGGGTGGLTLDGTAEDLTRLLEGTSRDGVPYVVPFDSAGSYLIQKLDPDFAGEGDPMPPGVPLDAATRDRVAAWIDAGALP